MYLDDVIEIFIRQLNKLHRVVIKKLDTVVIKYVK